MKWLFPAVLLLFTGCFSCGRESEVRPVDPDLKVYRPAPPSLEDRHSSTSLERVKPRDWVRYQVTRNGGDTMVTLGAVKVEDKWLWVEVIEEGDPKRASLRRITYDGEVMEARFQEIPASGPASEIVEQPILPAADSHRGFPSSEKVTQESRQFGSATHTVKVIKRVFTDDALGREFEEEEGWLEGVPPLMDGLEKTGLAFRKTPTVSIKLLEWGTDYTPAVK